MTFEFVGAKGGDALWVVADRIRFLGGLPGSDLAMIEVAVPTGSGTPPHSHASAEMFYVTSGQLTLRLFASEGEPPTVVAAGPGEVVRIPSHMPHNYANEGSEPVKMVVLLEPAMIAFFRDIGTETPQDTPDCARLGAAMEKHGITVLGMAA